MLRRSALALGTALSVMAAAATPVVAQGPAGPLCVLSAVEMGDLLAAPIATVDAVDLECAYTADIAQRQLQVVLSITPPDPTAFDTGSGPLQMIRFNHAANGLGATIAGQDAWVADDGVWVAVGEDVLGVLVNGVFDDAPPAMPDTAIAIAEAVVPRYLEHPRPSPPPPSGVSTRFPATLADQPLAVQRLSGAELFDQLGYNGAPATDHLAELRAAVAALGVAEDVLEVGYATVFDFDAGGFLEIYALRAPGSDVSSLVSPASGAFIDFEPAPPEAVTLAGHDATFIAPVVPDDIHSPRWFFADGDTLWVLSGDQALAEALAAALPPADAG